MDTGGVDPGREEGGAAERGGEDAGRYVKNGDVVSNGSSVVETESGMTLESLSPGEEVEQDHQLKQQQKLQQQEEHVGVGERAPIPLTMEGGLDIRLVPDREDGEEECGKKLQNYALKDSGAVMMDHSSTLKSPENLLVDSRDKYSISRCHEKKQVVIALSEDILVRAVVLGSYEKYSNLVKEFQVLGSQVYPTEKWMDLGTFNTSGVLGEETFDLFQPAFARYLKFKFIAHIGTEYFCTLSQIKVHGITALEIISADNEDLHTIDEIGGDVTVFKPKDNTKNTTTGKEATVKDGGEMVLAKVDGKVTVTDVQDREVDGQTGDYDRTVTSDHVGDYEHQNVAFDTYRYSEEATQNRTATKTRKHQHEQEHCESELKRAVNDLENEYILDNNNLVNPLPQEVADTLKDSLNVYLSQHEPKLHTCSKTLDFIEFKTRMMSNITTFNPVSILVNPYTKSLLPILEKIRHVEVNCKIYEMYSEIVQDCSQLHSNALLEMNEELVNIRREISDLKKQRLMVHQTPCVRVPPFVNKVIHNATYVTDTFGVVPVAVIIFTILLVVGWLKSSSLVRKNLNCRKRKDV